MFGAFNPVGIGAFGPNSEGIDIPGWVGTLPGLFIDVTFPGFCTSVSVFLKVCEGGASAVSEMIF